MKYFTSAFKRETYMYNMGAAFVNNVETIQNSL